MTDRQTHICMYAYLLYTKLCVCTCQLLACIFNRKSASCTHVSAILHALSELNPPSFQLQPRFLWQQQMMMSCLVPYCHVHGMCQIRSGKIAHLKFLMLALKSMIIKEESKEH